MRISLLSTSSLDYPSPRGRLLPVAHELAALGHEVRLLLPHHTYDRLPPARRKEAHGQVMVYYIGQMHVYGPVGQRQYFGSAKLLRVSLLGMLGLARWAISLGADALHVCKPQPINGLAGVLAARALGCPLYVDCDDYEAGGNRFGAAWQRRLVQVWEDGLPRRATGVTVNTHFLRERNVALGVPPSQLLHIPNGINPERICTYPERQLAGLRTALGLGTAPVVAYAGTLSQTTHNVSMLLDAFALLAPRMPAARLLLVGDGEDRWLLRRRVDELGLRERVVMTGPVPAHTVQTYLSLATCSVDPVGDDGVARGRSPLKIVESLAVGTPVVTGDVGDRAEMLGDSGGVLVAPGSASALADGIEALLSDPREREYLAAGARARAEAYRWDRLARIWATVYSR